MEEELGSLNYGLRSYNKIQPQPLRSTPAFSDTSPLYLSPGGGRQGTQKLQEPHVLLMRMHMGRWFSENCLEVSTRAEYIHIL